MSPRGWTVLLVLGAVLLLVPGASAASSDVEIEFLDEPRIASGNASDVPVKVIYTYEGSGSTTGEVDVRLRTSAEGPTSAKISPRPLTIDVNDQRQRGTGRATLTISMGGDANAFDAHRVTVEAQAKASGTVEASDWRSRDLLVQVDYVPALTLSAERREITVSGGSTVPVTIDVVNDGNGRTRYSLVVVSAPDAAGVAAPPPKTVAHTDGANADTVKVRFFRASSEGSVAGDVTLRASYDFHESATLAYRSNTVVVTIAEEAGGTLVLVGAAGLLAIAAGGAVWWFRYR